MRQQQPRKSALAPVTMAATKLNSLTVIRAIAATSVVFYHTTLPAGQTFGEFGVDIFFVLSGFVIALVIGDRPISVKEFLIGRLARVAPLYWLATFAVFCLAAEFPRLFNSTTANLPNLLKSLFFVPYRKESGLIQPMLFVGWTLNFEMLFYGICAFALLFARKYKFTFVVSALLAVFTVCHLVRSGSPIVDFFANERTLEFLFGIGAWVLWRRGLRVPPIMSAFVVVFAYCAMATLERSGVCALPLLRNGVPAVVILFCSLTLEPLFARREARLFVFLGDASYATYLSHPYVVEAAIKILPKLIHGFDPNSPAFVAIIIASACAAGSALYVLVDRPLHRSVLHALKMRRASSGEAGVAS